MQKQDDEGYLRQSNATLQQVLLAEIRSCKVRTSLKLVQKKDSHLGSANAKLLVISGAKKPFPDTLQIRIAYKWTTSGAKLSKMTQELAYLQDRVLEVFNIDRSIRSKHISGMASQFLWKVMHDIYMIGHRWLQESMLEEYHDRAICVVCGNVESIDHILFRCEAVGQAEVWGEL
ncbi:hypothetical protein BD311DRAFT_782755 [Dichomitus squalens]|uniref:Uncharacterized protein n=1 Tax=Dichomitus squalens TaxID=114155 RepID=A0A4Q9M4J9_9APHY|nr:hypothetical protein BD311DRAFT_782755 [Dichomitus squalens]